MSILEKALI